MVEHNPFWLHIIFCNVDRNIHFSNWREVRKTPTKIQNKLHKKRIIIMSRTLKTQCHEDIAVNAVLKSFVSAPYTKCSCRVMRKISIKFHQGALTIKYFGDFCRHRQKTWKSWHNFFQLSTDPFPSSPCEATNHRKQFQCLNVVVMPTPSFLTSESYSISSLQGLWLKIGEHWNPGLLNVISTRPLTLHNCSTTD